MAEQAGPAEVRARLRAEGIEVPDRGRISADHRAEYERLLAMDHDPAEDLADAPATAAGLPPEAPPAEAPEAPREVVPRRPKSKPARGLAERVRAAGGGRSRGKAAGGKARTRPPRTAHPRVSVAGLIGWAWGAGARAAAPVSGYLSQCLAMQAPVAGLVLEDQVRGTVVDRALQPLARGQARLEGAAALFVLPMAVAALEATEGYQEPKRSMRRAFLVPLAVEGAVMWVRVAGPKVEQIMAEQRERGPEREQAAALLVSMGMPFLTAEDLGVRVEGQAPGPGPSAYPYGPPGGEDLAAEAQRFAG